MSEAIMNSPYRRGLIVAHIRKLNESTNKANILRYTNLHAYI